ncbi:MAG: KH domain-containing protein [Eubacteriales bacterium]|nr:KH domain-containing protein [Clostridiales bacterium]MDD7595616.1 KH domain-containing protein [Clostridiales bacterium]MDY4887258.1 KH domain-containing protein [Eubacteriales bacterium]MDY5860483.1 KH domain-containing protein [Eubacteriales bacterium]
MEVEKIVSDIAKAIVDTPDEVSVTRTDNESDGSIELLLTVAPDETGMVIGRHGKIAKAIRTVVKAASAGSGRKVTVEIK